MIELKYEEIDGEKCVILGDKVYRFVEEVRGAREKFWLVQNMGAYLNQPYKNQQILFKFNRNDVSCENWGEIYASRIAKQIHLPCVEYHLAKYIEGDQVTHGVVCGSFKKNDNEVEISVFELQKYADKIKNINTVDETTRLAVDMIPDGVNKNFYFTFIRDNLIKQCIFDFLLAQTDRHWFNTAMLVYYENGRYYMRKADCYDSGCVAFLKRKFSAIEGISREIKKQGEGSQRLHDLLSGYVPMMGIKTSTVEINRDKNPDEKEKLKPKSGNITEIFLDELTDEILNNAEIAVFYQKLKSRLNVKKITENMAVEGIEPPQAVADMVELVVGYQFQVLNTLIKQKIKKLKNESGVNV